MLRRFTIARFASKHSPEREERLLSFAGPNSFTQDDDTPEDDMILKFPEGGSGNTGNYDGDPVILRIREGGSGQALEALSRGDVTLSARQEFHDALFNAIHADDQRRVLQEFRPEIEGHVGTVETLKDDTELDEVMQLTRLSIVDELNREERERSVLAGAIRNIDTSDATDEEIRAIFTEHEVIISRYFKLAPTYDPKRAMNLLQCLLHRDMERIRARDHEREKGVKWHFMKADEFADLYRKLQNIRKGSDVRIPNAFTHGNTMYFNAEHADFNDETNGQINAERAVTHEATHLSLRGADTKFSIDVWANTLRSHPDWAKLKEAVEAVYRADPDYIKQSGKTNHRIVDEALAIYATNTRHAPPAELASQPSYQAQMRVRDMLQAMFDQPHTGFLTTLKSDLETRLDSYLEVKARNAETGNKTVDTMLKEASTEIMMQRRLEELEKTKQIRRADGSLAPAANPDEGKDLAAKDLKEASASAERNPAELLALGERVGKSLGELNETYPDIRGKIEAENPEPQVKAEALAALDQNLEWISQQQNDITLVSRAVQRVKDAEEALAAGELSVEEKKELHATCIPEAPNPYENLTDDDSEEDIAKADAEFENNRRQLLDIANDVLTQTERIADRIKGGMTPEESFRPTEAPESGGIFSWLNKNVWGPDSGIVWVSPLNVWNIIKIYKEAIQENYRSNQTVKQNRIAKNLNFYQPIQHTLNKQARSSNEKETSEFKEYIEREGFTFDEIFGNDGKGLKGGLLHQNRHNFNRAKAVLLYAADHAWLYFMDRLHGHDVYGIDYQGIEGHQSFEELVSQNEAGKSKEIDKGRERVDKDPDVPPIMDAMVHELRLKNIFAVQGIMKRLQEKAKYSHSNTWMLVTLLMLIRDESAKDPTLKLCLDKGMIDNISNFTIEQSAWSITWLKVNRHQIEKWKNGDKFGNNETTAVMEKIEQKLKEAGCNFPNTNEGNMAKYEAIAMVMAGKTFSAENTEARVRGLFKYGMPKQAVSIFQDDKEMNDYRQAFRSVVASTDTEPGNTDSDYFNPDNGGADLMLLDAGQTSRILSRKSTSEWNYVTKARGFITQVLQRYDELERLDPAAKEIFEEEMRAKFDYCLDGVWDKSRRPTVVKDTDLQGNNMVDQLASRKLFSESKIKELAELRAEILTARRIPMQAAA